MKGEQCDVCLVEPSKYIAIASSGAKDAAGNPVYDLVAEVCEKCRTLPEAICKAALARKVRGGR